MCRYAHCLVLLMAPLAVSASEALAGNARGGCVYTTAEAERAAPAATATSSTPPAAPKPAANSGTSTGGGGDDDMLQRIRAPKWHSFLPGMFR